MLFLFIFVFLFFPAHVTAQEYIIGQVQATQPELVISLPSDPSPTISGLELNSPLTSRQKVVLLKTADHTYQVIDHYRIDELTIILGFFFFLVVIVSHKKGLGSIVGLFFSLFILLKLLVPGLLSGIDPLFISIVCSIIIMVINMYLAHGLSPQTHIALFATVVTLVVSGIISAFAVSFTGLSGLGSESAGFLQLDPLHQINLRGLLLGGIIIGSLGVLDDITIGQTTAIWEIFRTDPRQSPRHLFHKGLAIGKEHVNSLVNTLVLAYAGASLPLFVLFAQNTAHLPLWLLFNNELVAEEIVRTLSGSIALILGVPITTYLASRLTPRFY